jgi:hypothetical protein
MKSAANGAAATSQELRPSENDTADLVRIANKEGRVRMAHAAAFFC